METIPIPAMATAARRKLSALASLSLKKAEQRLDLQHGFCHRITDLAPHGKTAKLTTKLEEWWDLDFQAFRTEVKKQFKQDIPLTDRDAWEKLFTEQQARVEALSAEIAVNEREIDDLVYALFELTAEEIALIEAQ